MSLHPPAPSDLGELVEAYAQTVQSIIDLGRTMRPDDAGRPTDCPGWTVLDQIAHVASTEAMVAGEPEPDVDVSHHTHVRHSFGARIEKYVESRRGRDLEEVLDELEERLEERLRRLPLGHRVGRAGGARPVRHDDLGRPARASAPSTSGCTSRTSARPSSGPGGLDTGAAALAVSRLFAALPRIVAKDAGIEPGNAVVLDLTGPTVGRAGPASRSTTARRAASRCSPGTPRSTPTSSPPR